MSLVLIGRIIRPKGLNGTFEIAGIPNGLIGLKPDSDVFVGFSQNFVKKYTFFDWKDNNNSVLLRVKEIQSPESVKNIADKGLFTQKENLIFNESLDYLDDDIIGCKVFNNLDGEYIGNIINIVNLPSNNLWIIEINKKEVAIPVTDSIIKYIDTKDKVVKIELIEGLLELNL